MTKKRLAEIQARCEAATEGPWEECKEAGADIVGNKDTIILEICRGVKTEAILRDNNLQFIAHARQDLPDCLDEIKRLRGELRRFEFIFSNKRSKPFRLLHDIARKALEGTEAPD